jgi:hypothetical protein
MNYTKMSILGVMLAGSFAVAQNSDITPSDSINTDSLLDAGMDELISYLLLTREDFRFRDDYIDIDSFRLDIVDSLMAHPLELANFTQHTAEVMASFVEDPQDVLTFCEEARGSRHQKVSNPEKSKSKKYHLKKLQSSLAGPVRNIAEYLDSSQARTWDIMGGNWSSERNRFIANEYREIILEDPDYLKKSPEVLDSIQQLEEEYSRQFAKMAEDIMDIPSPDIAFIFGLLDDLQVRFSSDKSVRKIIERSELTYETSTSFGKIAIGSAGDDVYRGEYFMIFDPSGDDSYYMEYDIENPHPTLVADYSGNDFYKAKSDFALASGAFSYSFLIDFEGDDIYDGDNFSLGSGFFGVGILWDKKGNDIYFGDTFTQGAGTFGLGLLIDGEGSDSYTGNFFCQGFGFVRGIGGIVDYSGNDNYTVQGKYSEIFHRGNHYMSLSQGFGYGFRPELSGGFGFICDYAGNDAYIADFFAQGSSYWWALGMLYDGSGNDQYITYQYAQGAGAHMTLGILLDGDGDDVYRSHSVSQGCGHDYSCGWLLDISGDDIYSANNLAQGAGQANGMGIFTDVLGNDGYYVIGKNNTQGYGNPRRDYGSIGLFLDADGEDRYDGNGSNDRFWRVAGKWGGGLDKHLPAADTAEAK